MRGLRVAAAAVVLLGFAGCGADKNSVMPDVTGTKLDVAKSVIKDAGFDDEVKVDGGGVFGVVKESNWEVCEQSPTAGEATSDTPTLKVDRSCPDDAEPSEASKPSEPSKPVEASKPSETDRVLTADNSEEFAALLKVPDTCGEKIASFAAENAGRTIEFDGSVVNMAKHGDYDTRYDILIAPGNKGPESTVGPAFKFEDVNFFDLKITGTGTPNYVDEGDRFRFVAKVGEYNPDQCLFFLEPVSTRGR